MKYLKTYEKKSMEELIELLNDLINENPLHKDHDFYIFIGKNNFIEEEDGKFRKTLEIERMIKITPDEKSIMSMNGLRQRSLFQTDSKLYNIWLPKHMEEDVAFKGTDELEDFIIDFIDKYKNQGSDEYGVDVLNKVQQRRTNIKKYNL
jgi:hypothetical protein